MDLQGKVALVTGGGTGIGHAVSMLLAQRGTAVAVNYSRSKADAVRTVDMINSEGGHAIAVQANVSRDEEVREMANHIADEFGSIDLLVNNAGVTQHIPLEDLESITGETWDEIFAVNVKGMFYCARAVAPFMKQNKRGAIVNIGSIAGLSGSGSSLPYAVSKAAVHGLTKSLARALAPDIKVCAIAPGTVATRWFAGREKEQEQLSKNLLLSRMTTTEEIAKLVCTVLELESMTGQILTIDSGQTL